MHGGKHLLPWDEVLAPLEQTTAIALWRSRDENEVAFQGRFFGKTLLVSARVISVRLDGAAAYIDAASSPYGTDDVLLALTSQQTAEAAGIRRGQDVYLACEGITVRPMENIVLTDCAWPPILAAQEGLQTREALQRWNEAHEIFGPFENARFKQTILKVAAKLGAK